jgi:sulfatase maturation enzyme AslB (radical SAM superfamily)
MSAGRKRIIIDFGVGETFLHFDEAMRFLDYLRQKSDGEGVQIQALITTNGTLARISRAP